MHGIVVTEALRDFVTDHGRPPRRDEQHAILRAQRQREDQAAHEHPQAPLLCDPATLMTAVYSQLYFDDGSLADEARRCARDYDALLWCRPDIPWTPDPGQHDGPEFRSRADAILDVWVRELSPSQCIIEVTGTEDRIARAQGLLADRIGSAWEPGATGPPT